MNDSRINSISQLREFVKGINSVDFALNTIEERYALINKIVKKFNYLKLGKKDKQFIRVYLRKLTGYKKAQLNRLIKAACKNKLKRASYNRESSFKKYRASDIKLLQETDALHRRLNRLATKQILIREAEVFAHTQYQQIAQVSASHIDNLRNSRSYQTFWVNSTKSRDTVIGQTKQPKPNGKPGSIRVDTVHQRDVYYINAVDEVTQWEIVVCVPQISERYLLPALINLLNQFPFVVFNFHSDRGSEFINYVVAKLLNKLLIEQTKSRSRHSNDNALVESKNGSVLRKNMGYVHIHFQASQIINQFLNSYFNPYLNYHRPCLYLTEERVNKKGRTQHIYGQATVPYEKLKEVSTQLNTNFLKSSISFQQLDKFAYERSDNEFAKIMRIKEKELFDKINKMKG